MKFGMLVCSLVSLFGVVLYFASLVRSPLRSKLQRLGCFYFMAASVVNSGAVLLLFLHSTATLSGRSTFTIHSWYFGNTLTTLVFTGYLFHQKCRTISADGDLQYLHALTRWAAKPPPPAPLPPAGIPGGPQPAAEAIAQQWTTKWDSTAQRWAETLRAVRSLATRASKQAGDAAVSLVNKWTTTLLRARAVFPGEGCHRARWVFFFSRSCPDAGQGAC